MGINEGTVRNYLSKKPISFKTIHRFAEALQYDEDYLMKGLQYYKPSEYESLGKRIDGLWNRYTDLEKRMKTLEEKMKIF